MSEELAGNPSNYETKLNFRREQDYEVRREGWEFFKPFEGAPWVASQDPNFKDELVEGFDMPEGDGVVLGSGIERSDLKGQSLLLNEPILAVEQIESRERIHIAASRTQLHLLNKDPTNPLTKYSTRYFKVQVDEDGEEHHYVDRYDEPMSNYVGLEPGAEEFRDSLDAWTNITPSEFNFSPNADRPQIVQLNGYAIINNGRDLPCVFHSDWMNAHPVYELREMGIVSANVVAQFNGLLLLADVEEFDQSSVDTLALWDRIQDPTKSAMDVGFYGCVKDSKAYKDGRINIVRIPYRVWYSNPGAPQRWGVNLSSSGALPNGSLTFTSELKSIHSDTPRGRHMRSSFYPGAKVRILAFETSEGEPVNVYNYRKIVSVTSNAFVFDKPLNFSYLGPTGERVTFSESKCYMDRLDHITEDDSQVISKDGFSVLGGISNGASFFDPVGDGTRILSLSRLKDRLVVFRENGYGILSAFDSGGDPLVAPFTFEQRYTGHRVPIDKFTAVPVNDRQLIYAGKSDLYSISISFSEPEIPMTLDVAKEFGYGDSFFLSENVLTDEIFICGPRKTLAYDYKFNTVSEIDAAFTCANSLKDPVSGLSVFLLGIPGEFTLRELRKYGDSKYPKEDPRYDGSPYAAENVKSHALFKYSYDVPSNLELSEYGNNLSPYDPSGKRRYVRESVVDYQIAGVTYESVIESGWIDFGNRMDEKDFRMYLMSFKSDPASFFIKEAKGDSETLLNLPFPIPNALPLYTTRTFEENRLALNESFELPQAPRLRILADKNFHLTVKLFSRDTVGGVHRLEVDETLTDRDEISIPVFFRSVFFKDRIEMTGADAGRVLARTIEASLVASGGRIVTIDS